MNAKFQKLFIIFSMSLLMGFFSSNTKAYTKAHTKTQGLPKPLPDPNPQPLPKPPPRAARTGFSDVHLRTWRIGPLPRGAICVLPKV